MDNASKKPTSAINGVGNANDDIYPGEYAPQINLQPDPDEVAFMGYATEFQMKLADLLAVPDLPVCFTARPSGMGKERAKSKARIAATCEAARLSGCTPEVFHVVRALIAITTLSELQYLVRGLESVIMLAKQPVAP